MHSSDCPFIFQTNMGGIVYLLREIQFCLVGRTHFNNQHLYRIMFSKNCYMPEYAPNAFYSSNKYFIGSGRNLLLT